MKTYLVLCLTVLAVSFIQASVTYKNLLQLAKKADGSVKADHEIHLGELDDEVDFQSMFKHMGHDFSFDGIKVNIKQIDDSSSMQIPDGNNSVFGVNGESDECACSGKRCICCNVLAFTYEGKQSYIYLCGHISYSGPSSFLIKLFLQGSCVRYVYVTRPTNITNTANSALTVGCNVYYVSSNKICFYLYFVVNGKTSKCSNKCLDISASHFGVNLKRATSKAT